VWRTIRPSGMQAWVATVSESTLAQLDLEMLLDLLRIEGAVAQWEPLSAIAASEANAARSLATSPALTRCSKRWSARRRPRSSRTPDCRDEGRDRLGAGPIARHVGMHFRTVIDSDSGSAQPVVSVARAERRAVAGRRSRQRRERRCHSTARGAASQFRRRRAPIGRATQEFAEPRRPAHGGHAAPARRRSGCVARARLNAGR
jgi:hypothetical protein